MNPIGFTWLIQHFALKARPLRHNSFIGPIMARRERADGTIEEQYIRSYDPGNDPINHLVFALKYDDLDIDLLARVFRRIPPEEVGKLVARTPSGRFARQIGLWYEKLTGLEVPLRIKIAGNYVPLLDPQLYVSAKYPMRNSRWRIIDNAIGDRRFLPIIRRTPAIREVEDTDWNAILKEALSPFPQDVLHRALSYFYFKETKSSFAIEREEAGANRAEKFVSMLHQAGREESPLDEGVLAQLQNAIVDERYREPGFRTGQNYIGQTTAYFREIIHSIGSPPRYLSDVMAGLSEFFKTSEGTHPVLRAAAISFPFVFVHPFEDGNGRLHRYLIHDLLVRGGIGGNGTILPVSVEILADLRAYDACLEQFSKPLVAAAQYSLSKEGEMTVENPAEIEGFYRYPDVTPQAEYLGRMLEKTIQRAIPEELQFLQKFDRARSAIGQIVDMPDRKRESLLARLFKNGGKLARKRRENEFAELTDEEIFEIEAAYREVFSNN